MKKKEITAYFAEVETEREYKGYFCSVAEAITIVILGSLCGLKSISQIHQWAESDKVREFLKEEFEIKHIPCYYWMLCLLKMARPESLNRCIMKWAEESIPEKRDGLSLALDGKTIRSTGKMVGYDSPLHVVSAQLCEMGITYASKTVAGKSNEIPAVQELLKELKINGCLVTADAMNCQKETANVIIKGKADYLLSVKENQRSLKEDIERYIQDESLQKEMQVEHKREKNGGRIERRTAFVTEDVSWLSQRKGWARLQCIGAIHREFETKGVKSEQWHYYISSRKLTAPELLHHARMKWSVETMHWLLDVHFGEDFCRVEDKNVQQNLNLLRKFTISLIKQYKANTNLKRPVSHIMFECLLDPVHIPEVLVQN